MKKRILVADDSVTIQKVIALTFAEEPFEIKSVGTGTEALERMKDWRPDLVLADVIMPQMNGYELCRAVKGQAGSPRIPVILLAGTFEAFDEEEARACGADGFVTKPFESGELIEKVKAQLEKGAGRPETADAAPPARPAAPPAAPVPPARPAVPPAAPVLPARPAVPPAAPVLPARPAMPPFPPAASHLPSAKSAEPDIWDILGEISEEPASPKGAAPSGADSTTPPLSPREGREVVDFGKMDMAIGKERTKIEARERDFFGLEVEDLPPELPTFDSEPVEEIGFEVEPAPPAARSDEEWTLKMEQPPRPSPDGVYTASPSAQAALEEFSPFLEEGALMGEDPVPPPAAAVAAPPPLSPPVRPPVVAPPPAVKPPVVAPPPAVKPPVVVAPPPVQPPVVAPPPAVKPPVVVAPLSVQPPVVAPQAPVKPAPVPAEAAAGALSLDDPRVEALVRRIIDEKVEKIAWEVIPELAETLIKEAIEKLKRGG